MANIAVGCLGCTPNHDILVLPYCHWLPNQTYFDPIALLGLEFRAKNGRQLWAQCALRRSWGVETTLQFSKLKTSNTSGHVQQHRARALWAYSDVGKSPCHQFPRIGHGILSSLVGGFKHFLFSIIYGMSSFPLTFIFFKGVGQPPTRSRFNQPLHFGDLQ